MIDCKDNKCRLRISGQVLSSPRSENGQIVTDPEELLSKLLGTGNSLFNNKQSRRMLQSINETMDDVILSSSNTMLAIKDDF